MNSYLDQFGEVNMENSPVRNEQLEWQLQIDFFHGRREPGKQSFKFVP